MSSSNGFLIGFAASLAAYWFIQKGKTAAGLPPSPGIAQTVQPAGSASAALPTIAPAAPTPISSSSYGANMAAPAVTSTTTKAIAINNPGKLKDSQNAKNWRGYAGAQDGIVAFDTPVNGLRRLALSITDAMYSGRNSLVQIITAMNPGMSAADISKYAAQVGQWMDISPTFGLSSAHVNAIMKGIIQYENGQQPYSDDLIQNGFAATWN